MWDDLRELTQARQEALAGAKQVHVFDRDADETIAWIGEKEAAINTDDYGHDLDSIQALVRRHQGFERDLAAVKEQVSMWRRAFDTPLFSPRCGGLQESRENYRVRNEKCLHIWKPLYDPL